MGIDEMNELRAKLGLKPLKLDDQEEAERRRLESIEKEKQAYELAERERKLREAMALEDRIKMMKEKRMQQKKKQAIGTLGDEDDDDDSATGWVERARLKQMQEKQKQILKHLEEEEEASDSDDDPIALREKRAMEKAKKRGLNANGSIVAGLKVRHDITEFESTEGTILTLADKRIVEKGKLIDDGDELEDIHRIEEKKTRRNLDIKAGKGKYDPYSDSKEILPQYNDEEDEKKIQSTGFTIVEEDQIELTEEQKLKEIQKKMEEGNKNLELIAGDVAIKPMSDYLSKDEIVSFKKKKKSTKVKKEKKKKKLADEIVPMEDEEADLGSRRDREARQKEAEMQKIAESLDKREKYKKAIEKADANSRRLMYDEVDVAEEENELFDALANARKMAEKERKHREEELASMIDQTTLEMKEARKRDTRLVFNSTTEFVKSIPTAPDEGSDQEESLVDAIRRKQKDREKKRKRQDDEDEVLDDDNMDVEQEKPKKKKWREEEKKEEMRMKEDELQKVSLFSNNNADEDVKMEEVENPENIEDLDIKTARIKQAEAEVEKYKDIEPVDEIVGKETLVGKGIASTLKLLRERGGANALHLETPVGRSTDKVVEGVNREGDIVRLEYKDERGREMTQKEAFRRLSYRFHGKAPGKAKVEKRLKKEEEELKRKQMSTTDTPLNTAEALQKAVEQTQKPYIVMGTSKILENRSLMGYGSGRATPRLSGFNSGSSTPSNPEKTSSTFKEIEIITNPTTPTPKYKKDDGAKVSFSLKSDKH
eukprot:TRINITY_DN2607_c0_g1_i4.p1 TRINITY_DN2607_c0_g1~~TRINITY_DN2607_c0_g1_i4.p1  ORF type:complete len:770 (+),score=295.69 TRINITY_DN2607_c0_g1_i4:436-2745(+)